MFKREKDALHEIIKELSSDKRLLKIIAYGSRIRGDNKGDSDLDVLIIVDKKGRDIKDKILDIFYSYELKTDMSFSLTILSLEEFEFNKKLGSPFIENIKKEGVIFYDSDFGRKENALKIPA